MRSFQDDVPSPATTDQIFSQLGYSAARRWRRWRLRAHTPRARALGALAAFDVARLEPRDRRRAAGARPSARRDARAPRVSVAPRVGTARGGALRLGRVVPGDGASPPPRLEASAGPTRAEDLDAVVEDVDDARDAFGPGSHPYESFSARGDPAPAADAFSADGASAGPLGVPAGSPSGAPVAYVPGAPSTSAPSPPAAPMSALTSALFNVGFFSTAVLVVVGVRRAARFWNGIPDLSEEERLRRMADFASAQTERVRDMPPL